ncbi:hypothetical protein RSOLAG1IB_05356 [Rhizoctonia solani AG-1 IB]|uniref:RBR-type E3 ubiquitin transferase n=1 Tax=Thanatephorus cucumeris (strain AG1-IB / isolate 7/3/14) TaxID=1108050 RepID=A0A0B7G4C5_THACB|nr:hypothetical protein RSOLAG1IB_05356 [Rhizoctonia solani AG-1 IB]
MEQNLTLSPVLYSHPKVTRSSNVYREPQSTTSFRQHTKSAPSSSTCTICLLDLERRSLLRPTRSCAHGRIVCQSCLQEYVTHAITVDALTRVVCPDAGCRAILEYEDIVKIVKRDADCLSRFNDLIAQRHTIYLWCPCPECNQGQVHNEGAGPLVICEYCHAETCFAHRDPWDECTICKYDIVEKAPQTSDQVNEEYIAEHYKRCPNPSCGLPIEKIDGCDHMECRCGHEFCWECLEDHTMIVRRGRHFHRLDCSHYVEDYQTPDFPTTPRVIAPYYYQMTPTTSSTSLGGAAHSERASLLRPPSLLSVSPVPSALSVSPVPSLAPISPSSSLPSSPQSIPRSASGSPPLAHPSSSSSSARDRALIRGYARIHICPPPNPGMHRPPSPPSSSLALPPFLLPESTNTVRLWKRRFVRLVSPVRY